MHSGGLVVHIVKNGRRRKIEPFDQHKLHQSLVAACLASGTPTGHAEHMARRVTEDVIVWLQGHQEVTSNDLRRVASRHLRTYHPDASYFYEHHRSTL